MAAVPWNAPALVGCDQRRRLQSTPDRSASRSDGACCRSPPEAAETTTRRRERRRSELTFSSARRKRGLDPPIEAPYLVAPQAVLGMRPEEFGQRSRRRARENSTVRFSSAGRNAPGGIRIPNLLIRSQVLYPVELRALGAGECIARNVACPGEDSNLHVRVGHQPLKLARLPIPPPGQVGTALTANRTGDGRAGNARGGSRTPTGD